MVTSTPSGSVPDDPVSAGGADVLRRTGALAGTRILAAVVQVGTIVVVARALAPDDFAVFSIVLGALVVAQAFFDGGCTQAVARHHADPARVRDIVRIGRMLALVAALVGTATIAGLATLRADPLLASLLPLGVWIAAERQGEVHAMYLVAHRRTGAVVLTVLGRRLLVLAACLAALLDGWAVTWAFSLASLAGSVAAATLLARLARNAGGRGPARPVTGHRLRATAAMLLPFWATGVGSQLRQLDVTVLAAVTGIGSAAAYAPASRLVPPLRIVPTTYAQVLLAHLARERRGLRARELWAPCAAAVVVFGGAALVAGPLVPVVLGPAYGAAVLPLQLSLLGLAAATAASILTSAAQAVDAGQHAAGCAWASAAVTLASVAVLGHVAGAVGAAIASGLGFVVQSLLLLAGPIRPRNAPREEARV